MHYIVHERCSINHATLLKGQVIIEGDMPRDALKQLIAAGKVEVVEDTSPPAAQTPHADVATKA